MRIPLGKDVYIEADDGPRDTPFHKRIVRIAPIPNTRAGHWCELECGHQVQSFGDLAHTKGVILCLQCRDARVS